jgi:hypothetical protein
MDEQDNPGFGDQLLRAAVSLAVGFALIPVWGLAHSTLARLAIVMAVAVVVFTVTSAVRPLSRHRGQ